MTTISNIPKPDGGFYQVGDKLATKEEAIAFAQAVGWEFFRYIGDTNFMTEITGGSVTNHDARTGLRLPYTIRGLLPEHIATATTPNPPLTFGEAIEQPILYLDFRGIRVRSDDSSEQIEWMLVSHDRGDWSIADAQKIDIAVRRGNVYAHDPALHPPTPREDG